MVMPGGHTQTTPGGHLQVPGVGPATSGGGHSGVPVGLMVGVGVGVGVSIGMMFATLTHSPRRSTVPGGHMQVGVQAFGQSGPTQVAMGGTGAAVEAGIAGLDGL
jgi:hypothetical protein